MATNRNSNRSTKKENTSKKGGRNKKITAEDFLKVYVNDYITVSIFINDDVTDAIADLHKDANPVDLVHEIPLYCNIQYFDLVIKSCYIRPTKNDDIFIAMPSRKMRNDDYMTLCFFIDEDAKTMNNILDAVFDALSEYIKKGE